MRSLAISQLSGIIILVDTGQPPVAGCNQLKENQMLIKKLSVRDLSMAADSSHRDYLSSSLRAFLLYGENDVTDT